MKTILEATYHLMFFKTYTIYPRWYEILLGIQAWFSLGVIVFILLMHFYK